MRRLRLWWHEWQWNGWEYRRAEARAALAELNLYSVMCDGEAWAAESPAWQHWSAIESKAGNRIEHHAAAIRRLKGDTPCE